MSLETLEFARRFMQHILPSGYYKISYYGILATANITTKREQSIALIGETMWLSQLEGLNAYEVLRSLIGKDPALFPVCKEGFMRRYKELIQMVDLFERDKSVLSRHINNIFKKKELLREATVAKYATVQNEGGREVERNIEFFNLEVIISVGYRIKSKRGTQFRIWASGVLKDYLIKGYALNEKRLSQQNEQLKKLQESVKILGNVLNFKALTTDESIGLLKIISDYAYALDILDQYDYQRLEIKDTSVKETYRLTYE